MTPDKPVVAEPRSTPQDGAARRPELPVIRTINPRPKYRGLVVPMVTPFTDAGSVDEPAVGRIVDHLISGGVDGIFALGTTGEAASIHPDQKRTLLAAVSSRAAGRATVYAGISDNCFRESTEAANAYRDLGADAVVAHMPSYYPLSDAQIESYFHRLADAVPLPLVLYNIPATTHHSIHVDSVDRLRHHPNIVAVKDSAHDRQRLASLLQRTGGRDGFPVLLGNSALFVDGLQLGGVGLIPSGAHLAVGLYRDMLDAAVGDRWSEVQLLHERAERSCASYLRGRTLGESLAMLKAIMERRGLCGRTMLPPLETYRGDPADVPLE